MRNAFVIAILLAGTICVGIAMKPGQAAADEKPPQTVMVVYDLRDYLQEVHDYPLHPALAEPTTKPAPADTGATQSLFGGDSAPVGSPRELLDNLEKLIESTVQPDTWLANGGSAGSITDLAGKLYVMQTQDGQAQIKALLAQVTGDAKRTVRISATWMLLSDDELAALREPAKAGQPDADTPLSESALAIAKPIARTKLLCLNDQTIHITTGTYGIKLQVHPTLTGNGKEAIVDVLNAVGKTDASAPTTKPASEGFGQQFHTTARIPLGANIVIGGITAARAGKDAPKQLYFVIRVDAGQ